MTRTLFHGLLAGVFLAVGLADTVEAQSFGLGGTVKARGKITPQAVMGTPDVIDFENRGTGEIISSVYGAGGSGPILVNGFNPSFGMATNAAIIFDSAMRTGGDSDLGTPNIDFFGPGIDSNLGDNLGGEAGSPFQNDAEQLNVLIIAEDLVDGDGDGFIDDPDDADLPGSLFSFDFSALGTVTIHEITILDVESDEPLATVEFFDAAMQSMGAVVILPNTGDNGLAVVDLGDVAGVSAMAVSLNGSGAIDDIKYSTKPLCSGELGDFVWNDKNCDGIQDPGEPGIPNVFIVLKNRFGQFVASTTTDANGEYLFSNLCTSRYSICVDESTLPPGFTPAPCDQGGDDQLDNDCSPVRTLLDPGEVDRSFDFGYCEPPNVGEGCTPGYWKQPQHFDSWPAPYTPNTLFSSVFEDAFPGMTLVQVADQGGGGLIALGRHTVAALLNGANDGVDYGPSAQDVIDMFNDVYPSGNDNDYTNLKDVFEGLNESGCPLN